MPSSPSAETELLRLKKLDYALSKFSTKKHSATKTNILRLVLLPYLRSPNRQLKQLNSPAQSGQQVFTVTASVLLSWWTTLLKSIQNFAQLASIDKNCYLECISRIVSHPLWSQLQDPQCRAKYAAISARHDALLLQTFELAIARLSVKQVSLSISAFAGKIFAYAFFRLPDISRGLSFLLNTRVRSYSKVYNCCVLNRLPGQLVDRTDPATDARLKRFRSVVSDVSSSFPKHLAPLFTAEPRRTRFKAEGTFLNSVYPPSEKIQGINETKGTWCNRWSSLDRPSLFYSFVRHYFALSADYFRDKPLLVMDDLHTLALPGFITIMAHIYEIADFQLHQRAAQRQQQRSLAEHPFNATAPGIARKPSVTIPAPIGSPVEHQTDKIIKLLRDFLANPRSDSEAMLSCGVIKAYEGILKLLISQTKILDTAMVDQVSEPLITFIRSVKPENAHDANDTLDWHFWIEDVCMKLLFSRNINLELRALSLLYQLWDYIPEHIFAHSADQNLKYSTACELVSDANWVRFMGHYLPLVRSFYCRFVVWKVLGLTSVSLTSHNLSFRDSINRAKLMRLISKQLQRTYEETKEVRFRPLDPALNRKLIILSVDSADKKELIRTLPYEILDDAAYSCASLSVTKPEDSVVSINSSDRNSSSSSIHSADVCSITSQGTVTEDGRSESKKSSWVSRLFKKKKQQQHQQQQQQQQQYQHSSPKRVSSNGSLLPRKKEGPPMTLAEENRSRSSPLLRDVAREPSRFDDLLHTPPKIFSQGSSPSLSSKSSSPSLISSVASTSSPQSSASSLDFLDEISSTNISDGVITRHQQTKFLPPELNYVSPELATAKYKFQLVNNLDKIDSDLASLRELNSTGRYPSDISSNGDGNSINITASNSGSSEIVNEKPHLPSLYRTTLDPGLSDFSEEISELQPPFELKESADTELSIPEPQLDAIGLDSPKSIYFSANNTPLRCQSRLSTIDSENSPKLNIANPTTFANGLHEFNRCVSEFETFVSDQIRECQDEKRADTADDSTGFVSGSDDDSVCRMIGGMTIYDGTVDKLQSLIPWMVPETPERAARY